MEPPPANGSGRAFHLPSAQDIESCLEAERLLTRFSIPDQPLPGGRVWKNNPFRVHRYGMERWSDLFNARQLVALLTFTERVSSISTNRDNTDSPIGAAAQEVLALSVAKLADHLNSGCTWNPTGEKLQNLFKRQAIPMVWDYCEANPFAGSVGDFQSIAEAGLTALRLVPACEGGEVILGSATTNPLPDDSADAFVTDPPYYDSVPYADLSEFFYIWLRMAIPKSREEWFGSPLVEREFEVVYDENRGKDTAFYVASMTQALKEGRRVTKADGIGVIVFAHKSTSGWEALLQAVIDAGWVITASWPIDTELTTRIRAQNSAALSSSVHLVCRPRGHHHEVGDWRQVLREIPLRIQAWLPRLSAEGIVGADAIFACLGPALEIFSRYSSVEKASGEVVTLGECLQEVWTAVSHEALSMIFEGADASGFEEDARLTAMWLWTLHTRANGFDEDAEASARAKSSRGYNLEYDAARKIAQGLGVFLETLGHLVEVRGDTATLLAASARVNHLFGGDDTPVPRVRQKKKEQMALDFSQELSELEEEVGPLVSELSGRAAATVLDQLHQAMIFFGAGRGEALRRFLVDDGAGRNSLFWRLAQAFSALYPTGTDDKRWVDGVLTRKKALGF